MTAVFTDIFCFAIAFSLLYLGIKKTTGWKRWTSVIIGIFFILVGLVPILGLDKSSPTKNTSSKISSVSSKNASSAKKEKMFLKLDSKTLTSNKDGVAYFKGKTNAYASVSTSQFDTTQADKKGNFSLEVELDDNAKAKNYTLKTTNGFQSTKTKVTVKPSDAFIEKLKKENVEEKSENEGEQSAAKPDTTRDHDSLISWANTFGTKPVERLQKYYMVYARQQVAGGMEYAWTIDIGKAKYTLFREDTDADGITKVYVWDPVNEKLGEQLYVGKTILYSPEKKKINPQTGMYY